MVHGNRYDRERHLTGSCPAFGRREHSKTSEASCKEWAAFDEDSREDGLQRIAETDLAMLMRAANAGDQEAYRRLLDRLAGVLRGQVQIGRAHV